MLLPRSTNRGPWFESAALLAISKTLEAATMDMPGAFAPVTWFELSLSAVAPLIAMPGAPLPDTTFSSMIPGAHLAF